jgi:hypothetical protein
MIISSRTHGQGYYLNDNRANENGIEEADVLTCKHCQKVILKTPWKEDGGFCGKCFGAICSSCADKMLTRGCEPFVKLIEKQMEEQYRKQQNARIIGI